MGQHTRQKYNKRSFNKGGGGGLGGGGGGVSLLANFNPPPPPTLIVLQFYQKILRIFTLYFLAYFKKVILLAADS